MISTPLAESPFCLVTPSVPSPGGGAQKRRKEEELASEGERWERDGRMGGGRKRGHTQRRHLRQGRGKVWKHNPQRPPGFAGGEEAEGREGNPSWQPSATENPAFEDYYKAQQIFPEEEWSDSDFMNMLRKPLPATFRINASALNP
ncbi:hypothetical protein GUJ93_ZPchr0002g26603 [Zizania palustris]|uniref:Uncharacterized protein n=1 Tax=Zizania palustris TaxID=103762 RepID=A0A8J5RZD0_ZIZPA|nr:hypothetical protein GUJ93_ZPchr0002g26603 [Zizania palustris]KAG8057090.1 hypothetical protein GUJ93_ZPchr0002g26603 [Zizania palustris]